MLFLLLLGDAAGLYRFGVGLHLLTNVPHGAVGHGVDASLEVRGLPIGIPIVCRAGLQIVEVLAVICTLGGSIERLQRRREIGERFLRRVGRGLLVPAEQFVDVEACEHQVLPTLIAEHADAAVSGLGGNGNE